MVVQYYGLNRLSTRKKAGKVSIIFAEESSNTTSMQAAFNKINILSTAHSCYSHQQ